MANVNRNRSKRKIGGIAAALAVAALAGASGVALMAPAPMAVAAPAPAPVTTTETRGLPSSFAAVVKRVAPAVVNIQVTMKSAAGPARSEDGGHGDMPEHFKRFFGDRMPGAPGRRHGKRRGPGRHRAQGTGSGFIIDAAGHVVTNDHVVRGAGTITVTLKDGRKLDAELIGSDAKTDLALLKVEADGDLPFVAFGDSDAVSVGDWVIAVGNPFGLDHSVTAGIISARGRTIGSGPYDDFLQIDASINKGNSGGPSFNLAGRIIGVNTAIFSPNGGSVGIGFAIPAALAQDVIAQLKENGRVARGWLGVHIQGVTDEMADSLGMQAARGAIVAQVQPDSPAAGAGVRAGDVIVAVDGKAVAGVRDLPRMIARIKAGKTAKLDVWRDGAEIALAVEIAAMKGAEQAAAPAEATDSGSTGSETAGMKLAGLDNEARRAYGIGQAIEGVVVTGVVADSAAARRGIATGDVIVTVANHAVASPADVTKLLAEAKKKDRKSILLLVSRNAGQRFIALPLGTA